MYRVYELLNKYIVGKRLVNDYKVVPFEEEPDDHFKPGECKGIFKIKKYRNSEFMHELYLFADDSWSVVIVDDKTNEVVCNTRKDGYVPPAVLHANGRVNGLLMYDSQGNEIDAI